MILPAMKKYEAKIIQAKDNFEHIVEEVNIIGTEFAAIGHEMKEIVTKITHDSFPNTEAALGDSTIKTVHTVEIQDNNGEHIV